MWTEEHRRIYRREGSGYPSDLRDAEWARLAPLSAEASPGGRPRKTDMRGVAGKVCKSHCGGWSWYAGDVAITGSFGEDAHHDQEAG